MAEDAEEEMVRLREQALRDSLPDDQVVFGEGSPYAELMIVGEAPGAEEAALGRPFVGPAGKLLDQLLHETGLDRHDVWITNVVKQRPTKEEYGKIVNRAPRVSEIRRDAAILAGELDIVQPRVILCLGNLAARTFIGKDFKMGEGHGQWFTGPGDAIVMATFHPAWVLRQEGQDRDVAIQIVSRDFQSVKRAIQEQAA